MSYNFEFKKLQSNVLDPKLGTEGAAAFDLQAARVINKDGSISEILEPIVLQPNQTISVGTGIAIHIVDPSVGALIIPRSGRGSRGLVVGNLVGLIDSDYQGELIVCLWNRDNQNVQIINPLERIAQLMFVPVFQVNFTEVKEFSQASIRGDSGFGSSGTH